VLSSKKNRGLGVMVGDYMSRYSSWSNTIQKVRARLSKWKVKTLSVGESVKDILVAVKWGTPSLDASFRRRARDGAENIRSSIDDIFLPSSNSATRWVKTVPIKVSILSWRTRLDRLPTRVNLIMRGVNMDSSLCPVCNSVQEDSNHLFFLCDLGKSIFQRICHWWNIQWVEVSTYAEWNHVVFDSSPPRRAVIFDDIVATSFIWSVNRCSRIASLHLPAGRTAHSRFVIPRELLENSSCCIKQNTYLAELMQEVELIIWDEAPMTQKYAFEALDKTLRDILGYLTLENRNKVFCSLTVLLEGDFRQILPVIPKVKRADIVQAYINRSQLWKHCKGFTLT
nr:ATP-dependent DNA helicase PIF1-like [Tanacetum cinerariifolium]